MSDLEKAVPQAGANQPDVVTDAGAGRNTLDRDQMFRLAELTAIGEVTPDDAVRGLSPDCRLLLEDAVRELTTARLVRLIASQIAYDIHASRRPTMECMK